MSQQVLMWCDGCGHNINHRWCLKMTDHEHATNEENSELLWHPVGERHFHDVDCLQVWVTRRKAGLTP